MKFARYKSERVADHLRSAIECGELVEPLPSLRDWSSSLNVSTGTLQAALKILKREGLVGSQPKKGYVLEKRAQPRPHLPSIVRWLLFDPKHQSSLPLGELIMTVSQKLAAQQIGFSMERCSESRLQAIQAAGALPHELLIFSNLSLPHQKLFESSKNSLIVGLPLPGVRMPYISSDVFPAIRHATYRLLRQGCGQVDLINVRGRRVPESFHRLENEFERIRTEAPRSFQGQVIYLPTDVPEQRLALQRLANQTRAKRGFVVNPPISPGLLMMVFTSLGWKIPEDVEILPVNSTPRQMIVFPPIAHYPFPTERIAKAICKASSHYFKTGAIPDLRKSIPLELVLP